MTALTCADLVGQIRNAHPAQAAMTLTFGRCVVRASANKPSLITDLIDYYGPFVSPDSKTPDMAITIHEAPPPSFDQDFIVKQPDPGKTKIKEEWLDLADGRVVRKRLTGMVFIFGKNLHTAVGPCAENLNQVVNFINNRHIQWKLCQGALLGHAAGVFWKNNGRGLGLAGFSGAGKSTLALQMMNHGAAFVSNDRLMIRKDGDRLIMTGVAKLPRINPGTALNNPNLISVMSKEERREFSAMSQEDLWSVEHKYDAPIEECFGPDRFVLEAPMDGLVILNWKRNAGLPQVRRVNLAERPDLLPAFMKSTGLFFLPTKDCAMPEPDKAAYMDFLSTCEVFEIAGGVDFEAAAQEMMTWLSA